jgi:hypothetical protein
MNQSKQKKSHIKVCLAIQKGKEAKNSYISLPTEYIGLT